MADVSMADVSMTDVCVTGVSVTAVILAYGAEPYLPDAVNAVLGSTGVQLDLVVVDNGCTSDAVSRVKDLPGVRVLTPAENTGFAGGCAIGAAEATGEFLAFVNSDAIVAPDALAKLAAVAAEPGVGMAMGSIRLAEQPELINTAGNPIHYVGLVWAGGCGEPASDYAQRRAVPCGSGCCFAIRRGLWEELGGFAVEYFAYHEDTELSLRLWRRGLSVQYVPDAVVRHYYEFSRNALKHFLVERNRLALLLTTYEGRTLLVLAPMLLLTETAMIAAAVLGGWWQPKLRGYGWLWRNRRWVRARRALLKSERTVPDAGLVPILTDRFDPANIEAPPGVRVFNALARSYWWMARRLL
jgi:GT2 family glycosyltransferase